MPDAIPPRPASRRARVAGTDMGRPFEDTSVMGDDLGRQWSMSGRETLWQNALRDVGDHSVVINLNIHLIHFSIDRQE